MTTHRIVSLDTPIFKLIDVLFIGPSQTVVFKDGGSLGTDVIRNGNLL